MKKMIVVVFLCFCQTLFASEVKSGQNGNVAYDYDMVEDGARIIKITAAYSYDVVFPDQIDGVDVVDIASNAWDKWFAIKGDFVGRTLQLPKKVKRIHSLAVSQSGTLPRIIRFPKTLELLDEFSFSRCLGRIDDSGHNYYEYDHYITNAIFEGSAPQIVNEQNLRWINRNTTGEGLFGDDRSDHTVSVSESEYQSFINSPRTTTTYDKKFYFFLRGKVKIGMGSCSFLPNKDMLALGDSTISLSASKTDSMIYYTTNGVEPSACVSLDTKLYVEPFQIEHPTTIKAIVVHSDFPYTAVSEKTYLIDQPNMPSIEPISKESFDHREYGIRILTDSANGVIRYTTNGTEVVNTSLIYNGIIKISDTCTVRAKVFEDGRFPSEETTRTFTRLWYTCVVPVIEQDSHEFTDVSQEVSISCETDGAEILYTIDGSDPTVNGRVYKGPFEVYKTTTVRAIARKDDWKDSEEVSVIYTRADSIGEAANMYIVPIENDEVAPWMVDIVVSHDGESSVKSGTILKNNSTGIQTSVKKAGSISFWWRADCEDPDEDEGDDGYYDYGAFLVDDVVVAKIAGRDTEWRQVNCDITTGGKHIFRWEYRKDGATDRYSDAIWVDQIQWVPVSADDTWHTVTTPEPIPYSWLKNYGWSNTVDYESAANEFTGKKDGMGRNLCVWQDFVAGTNPTDEESVFRSFVDMSSGTPKISWEPDLNENGTKDERIYRVWGAKSLGGQWFEVNGNEAEYKFFKVTVDMK